MDFKRKYLKYKYKYLYLKKLENQNCITNNRKQSGGGGHEKYCDICGGPLYCGGFKLNNLEDKILSGGILNLSKIIDTDEDGLPDWWENEFIGLF